MPHVAGISGASAASDSAMKQLADAALKELSAVLRRDVRGDGRPSIPMERLLKASLLMALYTVRSERQLCARLDCKMLFS